MVVSVGGLYLTALRRADIEVDYIPSTSGISATGLTPRRPGNNTELPPAGEVSLCLFVSNTGAGGGVLERLEADSLEYLGDAPVLWTGISSQSLRDSPKAVFASVLLPIALESGDATTVWLRVHLREPDHSPAEYAAALGGLRGLRLTVGWTYARPGSALGALVPKRWRSRGRQSLSASRQVEIDCAPLRSYAIQQWRTKDQHHQRLTSARVRMDHLARGRAPEHGVLGPGPNRRPLWLPGLPRGRG